MLRDSLEGVGRLTLVCGVAVWWVWEALCRCVEAVWRLWRGCLESVGSLSGQSGQAVWGVGGCLDGFRRLSGWCGKVVWWVWGRLSGGCQEGVWRLFREG